MQLGAVENAAMVCLGRYVIKTLYCRSYFSALSMRHNETLFTYACHGLRAHSGCKPAVADGSCLSSCERPSLV